MSSTRRTAVLWVVRIGLPVHENAAGFAALLDEGDAVFEMAQDLLFVVVQYLDALVHEVLLAATAASSGVRATTSRHQTRGGLTGKGPHLGVARLETLGGAQNVGDAPFLQRLP